MRNGRTGRYGKEATMAGNARIEKISLALTAGLLAVACTTHSEPEGPAPVALTPGSIDTLIGARDTVPPSAAALTSGGKSGWGRGVSGARQKPRRAAPPAYRRCHPP